MTENLGTQFVEDRRDLEHVYKMSVCIVIVYVFPHGHVLPEHDLYSLEFLYCQESPVDVGPVILYFFLCSPHFVEMPVARTIHL